MRTWMIATLLVAVLAVGCGGKNKAKSEQTTKSDTPTTEQETQAMKTDMPDLKTLNLVDGPEGLQYAVTKEGEGEPVGNGKTATVHYIGWLTDGRKFDSSKDRGQPFQFRTGGGQVIRGWDLGVSAMKIGETRILVLPPELAYGQRGAGGMIPPGATLVFEVEVLDAK
ncbi:MAG: FKBP-type peptidyl-prolyl cis-trans isomerase [bacterium]